MVEKLTNIIFKSDILCDSCGEMSSYYCAEALAKHLLENNVIVLPYDLKLPENLWRIMFDKDERAVPVKCKVGKITDYGFTLIHYVDGREWNYKYSDLGVHIFYSKEAVEKTIEERKMNEWLKEKSQ